MSDINLHIDRLVIDESLLSAGGHAALHAGLEAELARRLHAGGIPRSLFGSALPYLPADSVQRPARTDPAGLGRQIASSIATSLGVRPPEPRS